VLGHYTTPPVELLNLYKRQRNKAAVYCQTARQM